MEGALVFAGYSAILFAVCMAGAYVPQIRTLNDDQKHLLIAITAGIVLGLLFWLFLPESFELTVEHGGHEYSTVCYAIVAGFLVIAFIDVLIKYHHMASCPCELEEDEHSHEMVSISAFIGLSIHACCDGLALAAATMGGETLGAVALAGMCLHKFVETFSLSSSLLLTDEDRKTKWMYLTGFSLITPIMGMIFFLFLSGMEVHDIAGIPMSFATGTFMFVTFCNLLPEAYHRKDHELKTFLYIVIGIALAALCMTLVNTMGGHTH